MSQSWVEKAILYQGECHEICNLILVVIYELRLIRNAKVLGNSVGYSHTIYGKIQV